ncbi:DNA (cytosine-5)-methyltransferase 1 [Labeo rohita]|uniref:DNA (Cytosine-5)-methyltransferase 1 n=1 Tax=Labeo rohita TaxID=84645 RepID=A0ABQ8MRS4_LABRO|nr:DNA (cytosine-5)-methyltransferase 1 [Labeo rohita]
MFAMPSSSSSRLGKLISTRILLRLSFMVSRTSPSVRERLAAPACSSSLEHVGVERLGEGLEQVSSSRGELKSGSSLKGVLVKLRGVCSCRCGVSCGPLGVRMGLKSSTAPFPTGVILQGSRTVGSLLGVDEEGWLLLMGVLKVYSLFGLSALQEGWGSGS